jgi:hypothetical protein
MISSDSNQKLSWMPSKGLLSMEHLSLMLDSFMKELGNGIVTSPIIMKPEHVAFIVTYSELRTGDTETQAWKGKSVSVSA